MHICVLTVFVIFQYKSLSLTVLVVVYHGMNRMQFFSDNLEIRQPTRCILVSTVGEPSFTLELF